MSSGLFGQPEQGSFTDRFSEIERRLRALESANRLTSASIGSGGLRIKDGGKITFLDSSGAVLATLDENGVLVAGAPVLLDGDGLDIGSGLVVVDSDGLKLDGILQPALSVLTESDAANITLTTTLTTINEVTFTIPSWADEVSIVTIARLQNSALPANTELETNTLINDVGGLDATTDDEIFIGPTNDASSTVALTTTVTNPGSTITCRQRGKIETDTLGAEARLEGLAIVRRTS